MTVNPIWLPIIAILFFCGGFVLASILAGSRRDELEHDLEIVREKLADTNRHLGAAYANRAYGRKQTSNQLQ